MSRQTKQADPLEPERHQCARVGVSSNHSRDRGSTMNVTTYGLDLAKRVFQVHWVEPDTGELKRKALARAEVAAFFARRAPGVVAMESCGSAPHLGRVTSCLRHPVPGRAGLELLSQREGLQSLTARIEAPERRVGSWQRREAECERLSAIPGVGRLTATAVVATIADARSFRSGREFAAFLGLVPRQSGTGGRGENLGISQSGDPDFRNPLIHRAPRGMVTQSRPQRAVDP